MKTSLREKACEELGLGSGADAIIPDELANPKTPFISWMLYGIYQHFPLVVDDEVVASSSRLAWRGFILTKISKREQDLIVQYLEAPKKEVEEAKNWMIENGYIEILRNENEDEDEDELIILYLPGDRKFSPLFFITKEEISILKKYGVELGRDKK